MTKVLLKVLRHVQLECQLDLLVVSIRPVAGLSLPFEQNPHELPGYQSSDLAVISIDIRLTSKEGMFSTRNIASLQAESSRVSGRW